MSTESTGGTIDRQTELRRFSKVTQRTEDELGFLGPLDGAALMKLRTQINTLLLKDFEPIFKKLAAGGKLMPDGLSAKLCMSVFGPRLTANVAYYTPAERSTKLGYRFTPEFLAAVAHELIPERAEPLLRDQPVELMRPCTLIMLKEKDYYVMGSFVDFTPFEKLIALMDDIDDPLASLRICSFCQRKDRMAQLVEHFSDQQVSDFIQTAHEHDDLLTEVLRIASHMSEEQKDRMKVMTTTLGDDYVQRSKERGEALGLQAELGRLWA